MYHGEFQLLNSTNRPALAYSMRLKLQVVARTGPFDITLNERHDSNTLNAGSVPFKLIKCLDMTFNVTLNGRRDPITLNMGSVLFKLIKHLKIVILYSDGFLRDCSFVQNKRFSFSLLLLFLFLLVSKRPRSWVTCIVEFSYK